MAKKHILDNLEEVQGKLYNDYSKKTKEYNTISTSFNPKQNNMSRYLTYGSRTYGQLGFDPTRDNNALYNANTSAVDDVARGYEGMLRLAKIGFNDTFALGVNKDKNSSFEFERTMNDYGSTRGGAGGFISNTMLSSGYTAGIMLAIAAEEVALTGITALTAGGGAGLQAGESVALGVRAANAFDNARQVNNVLNSVQTASDINKARTFFGGVKKAASYLKPLNPFDNTIDFVKDVAKGSDKIKDYSKTVLGAGALVRDMRKLYMTHSESKLEAEMAEREFFKNEYDKAEKESGNGLVDDATFKDIENRSKQVYSKVYTGNLGLIYATNAIGFDNMFKTMKGVTRGNSVLDNGLFRKSINKETGRVTFEALENPIKGIRKHLIDQKNNLTSWKGLTSTALSSSMEGVQELGQDVISTGTKNYYHQHKGVEQTKGGFLEQTYQDILKLGDSEFREALGEGVGEMMSWKGLETFMSGALMGAFAAPVGLSTKAANSFLFEGGLKNTYQKFKNTKEYEDIKAKSYKQRQAKAKVLTEFYNNSKNFVDFVENPVLTQQALQEEMLNASRNGDTFTFKNAQEKSFVEGIWNIMENGLENDFKGHLTHMANNFNVDELKEIFSREDITESNAGEFRKKLNDRVTKVDEYKKRFDEVNLQFKNPINLNGLTQKDPEFLDKYLEWKSYDSLRKDMVTSLGLIKDHSDRLTELRDEFSSNMNIQNVQQFSQFYDTNSLSSEIKMLEASVEASKGLKLEGDAKKQNDINALRLSSLKEYNKVYTKFQKELSENKINENTKAELFDAFKELHTETDWEKGWSLDSINKSFDKLLDYTYLNAQIGHLTEHTAILSNFDSRKSLALKKKDLMKSYDENKENYILNSLKEFETKKASDDMLNDLYENGFFFDLENLEDLIENQEMPDEIFNIKNNSLATLEEKIQAQEIISKHITNLKKLDLVEEDVNDLNKSGKKRKDDTRTLKDLFKQYDIKENGVIDMSTSEGFNFIKDLIESNYTFKADKSIFTKFESLNLKDFKLKFVTNSDRAVDISEDGKTYIVDLRFVSENYKVGEQLGFESLMSRVFAQEMIANAMENLDQNLLEEMMNEIKSALKDKIPVDFIPHFNDPKLFLSEVLNNVEMQLFLNDIQLSTAINEETMWDDFVSAISNLLKDSEEGYNFQGNALAKITALLNNAFIVKEDAPANVSEKKDEEKPQEEKPQEDKPEFVPVVVDDNLQSLYTEKNSLNIQLDQLKKEYETKKSKRLERQINNVAIKILKINDKIKALEETKEEDVPTVSVSRIENESYSMEYSQFGTEIISKNTPWANIPGELKQLLLDYAGLSSTAKKADIELLMENLQSNVEMQQIVTEYNARIESEEIEKRNLEQASVNKEIEKKRKQEFLTKARNKKKSKSLMENLQKVLGEDDFALLTENEKKEIEDKIRNSKDEIVPFTFNDVLAIINDKKRKAEKSKLKKDLKNRQLILSNISSIKLGSFKVSFTNPKGKKDSFSVDMTKDLLNYIKKTERAIFSLPADEFKKAFDDILIKYNQEKSYIKSKLKSIKNESELEKFILELMGNKTLIPQVASAINRKAVTLNSKLTLKINNADELFYNIVYSKRKSKLRRKKMTSLAKAKSMLYDFINSSGLKDENVLKAIVALGLEDIYITPELLETITKGNVDYNTRTYYITKKGSRKVSSTRDDVSDGIKEASSFFESDDDTRLDDVFSNFVLEYRDAKEAILSIANEIENLVAGNFKESYGEQAKEEDNDDVFYNTEDAKDYFEKRFNEAMDYANSLENQISIGKYKGSFQSLNAKQKQLYLIAVESGLYPESLEGLVEELNVAKKELKSLSEIPSKKETVNTLEGQEFILNRTVSAGTKTFTDRVLVEKAELSGNNYVLQVKRGNDSWKIVIDKQGKVITLNSGNVPDGKLEIDPLKDFIKVSDLETDQTEINKLKDYIANLENLIELVSQGEIIDNVFDATSNDTAVNEMLKDMNLNLRDESVKDKILSFLNSPGLSMLQLLALAKANQISLISDKNKNFVQKNILRKLNSFVGNSILYKGDILFVEFIDKDGTIGLSDYAGNQIFTIPLNEFVEGFERELEEGDQTGGEDTNTNVPEEQIKQVKEIYLKVFTNFEITNLNDEEIKTSLVNHIKEC